MLLDKFRFDFDTNELVKFKLKEIGNPKNLLNRLVIFSLKIAYLHELKLQIKIHLRINSNLSLTATLSRLPHISTPCLLVPCDLVSIPAIPSLTSSNQRF